MAKLVGTPGCLFDSWNDRAWTPGGLWRIGGSGPPPSIRVAVHPHGTSVVAGSQTQQFSAAVNGDPKNLGVTWAVDGVGGRKSRWRVRSPRRVFTRLPRRRELTPSPRPVWRIRSKSSSASIGVTDLAGVTTYHYNLSRDGVNAQEFALTTTSVRATSFGKLFSCAVDGAVYTEPLWLPAVSINGSLAQRSFHGHAARQLVRLRCRCQPLPATLARQSARRRAWRSRQ